MRSSLKLMFVVLIIYLAVRVPSASYGWSISGHQIITTFASRLLPADWRQLFQYYGWVLNQTVAYPDTYYRESDPNESSRHYIDLEVWSPSNPSTGTLPQAVEEFTAKMEYAIQTKDWNSMLIYAGRVAHYVEDATQPYHTTVNYNPVSPSGTPLHPILDSAISDHLADMTLVSNVTSLEPIGNLTAFALQIAFQSHSFLPEINKTLIAQDKPWSPELTRIVQNRTNTAIVAVARVWYTAIIRASVSPPEVPSMNRLSIIIENATPTANAMTTIRLRVVDSLGVKTYADVELNASGSQYKGQTADVIPPIGEYVIITGQGMLRGNVTFTASKEGYRSAILTSVLGKTSGTTTTALTETKAGHAITVPIQTVVGTLIVMSATMALIAYRRRVQG